MFAFGECGFAAEIPAFAGMEGGGDKREYSAKRDIASVAFGECGFAAEIPAFAGMEVFFYPPPLAGGGKNSRQRIFGGWRSADNRRKYSTPRDRFALAPPPRKRRRVRILFLPKKEFPFPPRLPFPRRRESPCFWGGTGNARPAPIIVDAVRALLAHWIGRFPLSREWKGEREWGCFSAEFFVQNAA